MATNGNQGIDGLARRTPEKHRDRAIEYQRRVYPNRPEIGTCHGLLM